VEGVSTMVACKQANEPEAVDRFRLFLRSRPLPMPRLPS
jgi:hypothetical protein